MVILGIESTCDETSVGIVENGRKIISSIDATSANLFEKYGGVVPEIAAREQVKFIIPLLKETFSNFDLKKIDAFAVAYGPGLIGSLLIGVETAKTLSFFLNKPLIAVNHLEGHVYANWLTTGKIPILPAIALIISGGHTDLVFVKSFDDFKWLGGTLDDSVGEAFDKVAKILGLSYPGGPQVEKLAKTFSDSLGADNFKPLYNLPFPMINSRDFNFSFSGIKTFVFNLVKNNREINPNRLCFEFQKSVFDVLEKKTILALREYDAKCLIVGGGVSANNFLRKMINDSCLKIEVDCYFPAKKFSIDNGAMIASAAFFKKNYVSPLDLSASSTLHF